jgi:RNA polymerase sporulation-specific sigma factor
MLSDKLVEENMNLAYFTAHKWNIRLNGTLDIQDIISDCTLGLLKASKGFKEEKGIKFATYATMCMKNQILMDLRGRKNEVQTIPLCSLVYDAGEENEYNSWEKIQFQTAINNVDEWVDYSATKDILENCLNNLKPRDKYIINLLLKGKKQNEVAEKFHINQSGISKKLVSIQKIIKKLINLEV